MLVAALFLVYRPVWHGKPLWDDDAHLTKPGLESISGLWRIWHEPGATQQYYPLTHSLFWIEHRIWGGETTGYHLLSIILHATSAWLLAILLLRLKCRAPWFAAALWALHPIQVESVAWISEQKNTLSGLFYIGAALAYLHFSGLVESAGCSRPVKATYRRKVHSPNLYLLALGLFLLGLLSKSTVATLPLVLMLVIFWQNDRLDWRRDILPLIPFVVIGLISGLFTAWMEQAYVIGGVGRLSAATGFLQLSMTDRILLAGKTFWFYLGKLCWPDRLIFIYPHWHLDPSRWSQWLFPIAAIILTVSLYLSRMRLGITPLITLLCYAVTIFPAMGFITIYPFRYSFVADHFQYLAGIAPIALAAAGMSLGSARALASHPPKIPGFPLPKRLAWLMGLGLLLILGTKSHQLSRQYADAETLWRGTLDKNPSCTLALIDLGNLLSDEGKTDEAIALFNRALEIEPDFGEGHCDLAAALLDRNGAGDLQSAKNHLNRALSLVPNFGEVHLNIGRVLLHEDNPEASMLEDRKAILLMPNSASPHLAIGSVLTQQGRWSEALKEFLEAVSLDPVNAEGLAGLGSCMIGTGRSKEAEKPLRAALKINPSLAMARNNLGIALLQQGRRDQAVQEFQEAVRLEPSNLNFQRNLLNTQGKR